MLSFTIIAVSLSVLIVALIDTTSSGTLHDANYQEYGLSIQTWQLLYHPKGIHSIPEPRSGGVTVANNRSHEVKSLLTSRTTLMNDKAGTANLIQKLQDPVTM